MAFVCRVLAAVVLSSGLSACAIHPLPENVTGVKTAGIVHRIRCEARAAVIDVAARIRPQNLKELQTMGIVYSFTLTMGETDSLMASATFQKEITNGTETLNPNLGDSLMRQNVRTFTVADTYQSLTQMDDDRCRAEPVGPNYQYPIVGTIGIDEMIHSFLTMALHENLSNPGTSTNDDPTVAGPITMVDSLTFTTNLTAGLTPAIMLTPVTAAAQLASASLTGALARSDVHEVIVGLGLPAKPTTAARTARTVISPSNSFPMLVTAATRPSQTTDGVTAALQAVNNQILRFEVGKSFVVVH
jgi:hypothetical protein